MKNNEKMIIGKFLLIFGLLMQILGMIPNCAHAQNYEEAVANEAIIDELFYEDFAFDADTGLWILHENDTDSEDMGIIDATYDMAKNEGKMTVIHKTYNEETKDYEMSETYDVIFKWYDEEEEFGIVTMNIQTHKYVDNFYLY